ncbi:MAG: S41 family peptidase [Bacteroidales bacterium]
MNKKSTLLLVIISIITPIYVANAQSKNFKTAKNLDIQYSILETLDANFVDSLSVDKLLYTGINSMLRTLDPYTVFIPEEKASDLEMMTSGSYGGVGSYIRQGKDGGILITEPYENSPAVKFGLQPGDKILSINGESTKDMKVGDASKKMRGNPNTYIDFTLLKARTKDTVDVKLLREKIHVPDVVYYGTVRDSIGYIQLGAFTSNGSKDVADAFKDLKTNHNIKRLVLDLRGNGGGLMSEAINIVSLFVPKGTLVVTAKGRSMGKMKYYTKTKPMDTEIPIMVLVNSSSASSSEIVTGALQDLDRAVVAGSRSFGKGLVQSIQNVGYDSSLKLTTAKYYTPSGRCVQALDYTHRNSDGSVGAIPDSLKHAFKTTNGKIVYDGGGIDPTVKVSSDTLSRAMLSLFYSGAMTDYAIKYYTEHDSIAVISKFKIDSTEYSSFIDFVKSKKVDLRNDAEIEMDKVILAAKRDKIYDKVKDNLESTKKHLAIDTVAFFNENHSVINEMLGNEIVTLYYYRRGRAEYSLRSDEQFHKALNKWDKALVELNMVVVEKEEVDTAKVAGEK